ncbi:MAG: hypothetical protein JKY29_03985 [Gammaproteobacteria bacterium]|nr:hypothetical protein [Gammaproteobacteria bacterium]
MISRQSWTAMKMMSRITSPNALTALNRPRAAVLALLTLLCCLGSSLSAAHEQKTAVTRILFNSSTGNIEVMHRFFIHDAEHAAGLVFGEAQNLMESADSRKLFSSYVMNRFAIAVENSQGETSELSLEYVGEEIEGQFLWVYQEAGQLPDISALSVVHLALRDVWPDQANLVNVEKDGQIYSLSFADSAESLRVEL